VSEVIIKTGWPVRRGRKPLVAAVGVFDGVHLGHRAVLATVKRIARRLKMVSGVIAFREHPLKVLDPERAPGTLTDPMQKERVLAAEGLDYAWVVPFTRRLSRIRAAYFVKEYLVRRLGAGGLVVGANFNFGRGREGNVAFLKKVGPSLGCRVWVVSSVVRGGRRVSSTRIRTLIGQGRVEEAGQLLGRPYEVRGRVVRGRRLGASLGYPTANLSDVRHLLPAHGVYVVEVVLPGGRTKRFGLANVGVRPTLNHGWTPAPLLEVHVWNWQGALYGQALRVRFLRRLRGERKFPSLEALVRQIQRDEQSAKVELKTLRVQ